MKPILIVDDNESILTILSDYARKEGYSPLIARTGEEALELFVRHQPCLVLLDVMLPGIDGVEVLKRLRAVSSAPILMITARNEDRDRVAGLDLGADDYIVKPFSPNEVMARIRAALRRVPQAGSEETLSIAQLVISLPQQTAMLAGKRVILTRKELELLWTLASKPGRVFTRDNLLTMVWGYEHIGSDRAVDTHIKRLRAKIDEHPHPLFEIKTVWGVGYAFEVLKA